MSPDSAPGSAPDDLIDLSDIMDDGPEGASPSNPQSDGDMSFDQELEDLFSDALPEEGPKDAPGQGADDDVLELGDELADFGGASETGDADDDLIDLSGMTPIEDDVLGDDALELTDLVEDGTDQDGDDILELTELEEIDAAPAQDDDDGAMDLDLTDLVEEPAPAHEPAASELEEPDLSDLLSLDDAKTDEAPGSLDALGDDEPLDLPEIDFAAAEEALDASADEGELAGESGSPDLPDLSDMADLPELSDAPELEMDELETSGLEEPALEMDEPAIGQDAGASLDAGLPEDFDEPADDGAPDIADVANVPDDTDALAAGEPEEAEDDGPIPAFAEEALDMAPDMDSDEAPQEPSSADMAAAFAASAASAASASTRASAVAEGIDLAALDAIIEEAGGPPAEEPEAAGAVDAGELEAVRERMAALEDRLGALDDKLAALPGQDALESLGDKLTAGFNELLRQGIDDLRSDLSAATEMAVPEPVDADALKAEIAGHVDARVEEIKAQLPDEETLSARIAEAVEKALENIPDAAALTREVKDAVLAEATASLPALPDADALALSVKESVLAEIRESLPEPAEPQELVDPAEVDGLRQEMAALSGRLDALAAEIAQRATRLDLEAAATKVKMGLMEEIERSASAAAVKVLREEIQALLDEME